jgi:hypothetical protein
MSSRYRSRCACPRLLSFGLPLIVKQKILSRWFQRTIFLCCMTWRLFCESRQVSPESLWKKAALRSIAWLLASDIIGMVSRAFTWMGCKLNSPFLGAHCDFFEDGRHFWTDRFNRLFLAIGVEQFDELVLQQDWMPIFADHWVSHGKLHWIAGDC